MVAVNAERKTSSADLQHRLALRHIQNSVAISSTSKTERQALTSGNGIMAIERRALEMDARGVMPDIDTFTAIVNTCAKSGHSEKAEKWLDKMTAAGIEPNVSCYSAMIEACVKNGDLEHAEFWHILMSKRGVQPNIRSFRTVINACSKSGNVIASCHWLDQMESAGVGVDIDVYNTVMDACVKVGDCKRAEGVFRQMRSRGISPTIVSYSSLAHLFAHEGEWKQVEHLADLMESDGLCMNEDFLYATLLAYSRARPRQADRAEATFRKACMNGIDVNEPVVTAAVGAMGHLRCQQLLSGLGVIRSVPTTPKTPKIGQILFHRSVIAV